MNATKIAKVRNPEGSKFPESRVYASGLPFPKVSLSCQCKGANCWHVALIKPFLASGLQHIGSRFKVYPETMKFLGPDADRDNVKVILGEIKARKASVEPTIKAKMLPPLIKNESPKAAPIKAAPKAAKVEAAPAWWKPGMLDIDPEEMAEVTKAHEAAKAAAKAKAEIKPEAKAAPPVPKPEAKDPALEAAAKCGLAVDLD
jgi:hypothetical protein